MTLKNKDGTVYRIDGPNPFMKKQELWSDCIKHNLEWKDEIVFDFLKQKLNMPVQESAESFLEEIEQKSQEKQEITPVVENSTIPKKEKREFEDEKEKRELETEKKKIEKKGIIKKKERKKERN